MQTGALFLASQPGSSLDRSDDNDGRPLRLAGHPGAVAARVGEAGPVPGRPARSRRRAPVRAGHVPLPVRRPAHGPRRGVRHRRRHRPALVPERVRRAAPHRLGLLRPARRERRDQAELATRPSGPTRTSRRRPSRSAGTRSPSTGRTGCTRPTPSTTAGPSGCSCAARARAGVPEGVAGQLVPEGPDRAGQRAGRRRRLRAVRHAGHQARADPVVLPDHRLRRPAAGRHGRAGGSAGRSVC